MGTGEPRSVRAVLVLIPGNLAGANTFSYLAEEFVERSKGEIEVWSIDRRANALEDLTGMEAAERLKNPKIGFDYYFNGEALNGRVFTPPSDASLSYLSEWGLGMFIDDLKRVINLIPAESRPRTLFLGGHSLGGWLTEAFAAWDFDGNHVTLDDAGFRQVAGLILIDGGGEPLAKAPAEDQYLNGGAATFGGSTSLPGLNTIRTNGPQTLRAPFGIANTNALIELAGMSAHAAMANGPDPEAGPDAVRRDTPLPVLLSFVFGKRVRMTNEAALGFLFDDQFQPVWFINVSLGFAAGGPLERFTSAFPALGGRSQALFRPTDPEALYSWVNFDRSDPIEFADLQTLARILYEGPTNFVEWHFPLRLNLDVAAVADMSVRPSPDDHRWSLGLRVIHTSKVDIPVFAFGAGRGARPKPEDYFFYRDLLAPVRGSGGAPRSQAGFEIVMGDRYTHMDPLLADNTRGENAMFGPLLEWVLRHSTGEVKIPRL